MAEFSYQEQFTSILKEELVPALGCTEPISIAFAGAKARQILGKLPNKVIIRASGNLIKNIRCVAVPHTDHLIGIEAAAIAGIVGGDPDLELEVLSPLNSDHLITIKQLILENICTVEILETPLTLHFQIRLEHGQENCEVEVKNLHTNISKISHNDQIIHFGEDTKDKYYGVLTDRSNLTVDRIVEYANSVALSILKKILDPQINNNMAIAEKGMNSDYGVSIGKAIIRHETTIYGKMKAYTAAASEARMCGSELPVITNSGSGNQGIAASVPIILYGRENNLPEEKIYRALALSNLLTIYQKTYIGRLSAFCGAISAAVASGAAITYLVGGSNEQIKMTIVNALADVSGIVCDGAKASCASKIATGLEAAFLAHYLALEGKSYNPFTGFVGADADKTITAVGRIAQEGMKETDRIILDIMLKK
ncbi:MAG: serine dehydratase subunit alpha family protein [Bacilli bacterium]|nr:serine dehydratase subunit alpha family protein [Bacilli bacterium]MBN2696313.1 serine dehydratase subunit alpha family protein [Bacilli bacterium]